METKSCCVTGNSLHVYVGVHHSCKVQAVYSVYSCTAYNTSCMLSPTDPVVTLWLSLGLVSVQWMGGVGGFIKVLFISDKDNRTNCEINFKVIIYFKKCRKQVQAERSEIVISDYNVDT